MTLDCCLKSAVTRSPVGLVFLLLVLMFGPAPALAKEVLSTADPDVVLYEVTEDMYLKDAASNFVASVVPGGRRTAVAQLSGWAKVGTPLCPWSVLSLSPNATHCTLNATGGDDLSLATGKGTLGGTFAVVVQGDNPVDAPEFVIMTGTFSGDADLSLSLTDQAPIGFITNGVATIDGVPEATFTFAGTFRLPFALDEHGRHHKPRRGRDAFYLNAQSRPVKVNDDERSLGWPTVRLEIDF
ncbi:MAG: hypothetical protein DMD38_16200 [Gemmatimonadetes bacterium]|nr:MAG: hypothetical protein DMD38_16200 [Gemmatimonadota bacterium]